MPTSFLYKENHMCDFCHKPHNPVYRTQVGVDSPTYWLGVNCRTQATKNWQENKEQGVENITKPVEREEENSEYETNENL